METQGPERGWYYLVGTRCLRPEWGVGEASQGSWGGEEDLGSAVEVGPAGSAGVGTAEGKTSPNGAEYLGRGGPISWAGGRWGGTSGRTGESEASVVAM